MKSIFYVFIYLNVGTLALGFVIWLFTSSPFLRSVAFAEAPVVSAVKKSVAEIEKAQSERMQNIKNATNPTGGAKKVETSPQNSEPSTLSEQQTPPQETAGAKAQESMPKPATEKSSTLKQGDDAVEVAGAPNTSKNTANRVPTNEEPAKKEAPNNSTPPATPSPNNEDTAKKEVPNNSAPATTPPNKEETAKKGEEAPNNKALPNNSAPATTPPNSEDTANRVPNSEASAKKTPPNNEELNSKKQTPTPSSPPPTTSKELTENSPSPPDSEQIAKDPSSKKRTTSYLKKIDKLKKDNTEKFDLENEALDVSNTITRIHDLRKTYHPNNNIRDPFAPFRKVPPRKVKAEVVLDLNYPTSKYDIEKLDLVGVVWHSTIGPSKALFKTPDGKLHTLEKHDRIGNKRGVLYALREDEVIILEPRFAPGEEIYNENETRYVPTVKKVRQVDLKTTGSKSPITSATQKKKVVKSDVSQLSNTNKPPDPLGSSVKKDSTPIK